jgi:RimJ/RimL family protein N-acetyltransferase
MLDDDPVRPHNPAHFGYFNDATQNENYYFHLRPLESDQPIGFVVLFNLKWRNQTAEMAIGIGAREYRGKGYGQEALFLLLRYAFTELMLRRVSLTVMEYNLAAIKAYERAGFQREGAHRQAIHRAGGYHDLLLYGILRDEWNTHQQP